MFNETERSLEGPGDPWLQHSLCGINKPASNENRNEIAQRWLLGGNSDKCWWGVLDKPYSVEGCRLEEL